MSSERSIAFVVGCSGGSGCVCPGSRDSLAYKQPARQCCRQSLLRPGTPKHTNPLAPANYLSGEGTVKFHLCDLVRIVEPQSFRQSQNGKDVTVTAVAARRRNQTVRIGIVGSHIVPSRVCKAGLILSGLSFYVACLCIPSSGRNVVKDPVVRHGTNSRINIFADQCVVVDVDIGRGFPGYDRNFSLAIICIDGVLSTKDRSGRTDVGRSHCYVGFEIAKNIALGNRLVPVT